MAAAYMATKVTYIRRDHCVIMVIQGFSCPLEKGQCQHFMELVQSSGLTFKNWLVNNEITYTYLRDFQEHFRNYNFERFPNPEF